MPILFIYFWPRCVFLAVPKLSLGAASGGCTLAAGLGLLVPAFSLIAQHGLLGV